MLTTITYITEVNGEDIVSEEEIASAEFTCKFHPDGDTEAERVLAQPVVTQNIEIENDGETDSVMDQCGNTERSRTGNNGWMIRVQGIVTAENRDENLTLANLRDDIAVADSIWIRSDVINGEFAVQNTVITQASDLVSIETVDTDGVEKAFEFQLQLGESQSDA